MSTYRPRNGHFLSCELAITHQPMKKCHQCQPYRIGLQIRKLISGTDTISSLHSTRLTELDHMLSTNNECGL